MGREERRAKNPKIETFNLEPNSNSSFANSADINSLKMQHMELIKLQKHLQENL